ncbi:MAG: response regulator [Fibrobacterales bacterium]
MANGVKIFHLEDSKIAQKILKKILGDEVEITFAASLDEALELIAHKPQVGCFIVDYSLFDGTGIDFIRHVRAIELYRETPILFQSSNLNNNLAYRAMKAGANESISKLISSVELRERVSDQIRKPRFVDVELENVEALTLSWVSKNKCYQYCPDLNIRVVGSSTVEAEENMRTKLVEYLKAGELDGVTKVDTFIHHIKLAE